MLYSIINGTKHRVAFTAPTPIQFGVEHYLMISWKDHTGNIIKQLRYNVITNTEYEEYSNFTEPVRYRQPVLKGTERIVHDRIIKTMVKFQRDKAMKKIAESKRK